MAHLSPSPSESRRALRQRYKDSPRPIGVYLIRNRVTQRLVLRASLDMDGAMNRDRFELRQGSHRDRVLQADWQQHGEAALQFEIVEQLRPPADDPNFDAREALALSLALWREELLPPQQTSA
jgi:hypothetical protein